MRSIVCDGERTLSSPGTRLADMDDEPENQ